MEKINLNEIVEQHRKLLLSNRFNDAENHLNKIKPTTKFGKGFVARLKYDLYLNWGKLWYAEKELSKFKIDPKNDRNDAYLYGKNLCIKLALCTDDRLSLEYIVKLINLADKNLDNSSLIHEIAKVFDRIGLKEAEDYYKVAMSNGDAQQKDFALYNYARYLQSVGRIWEGLGWYEQRFELPLFRTGLTLEAQAKVPMSDTGIYLNKNSQIVLVSEQGVGDQIRLAYLAEAIANKYNKRIKFYCDQRMEKYFRSENVEYIQFNKYAGEKAAYAYDFLWLLQDDGYFIHDNVDKITIDAREVPEIKKPAAGLIMGTVAKDELNDLIGLYQPELRVMEQLIFEHGYTHAYSLQYNLNSFEFNVTYLEGVIYSADVDYKNDWSTLIGIAKAMSIIVGLDSTQTILSAMSGVDTTMFVPTHDPIYLGYDFDVYQKNVSRRFFNNRRYGSIDNLSKSLF